MKKQDPQFLLVAIPRSIDFTSLKMLSKKHFHVDLSDFHTIDIPDGIEIKPKLEEVSRHVLSSVLKKSITKSTVVSRFKFVREKYFRMKKTMFYALMRVIYF